MTGQQLIEHYRRLRSDQLSLYHALSRNRAKYFGEPSLADLEHVSGECLTQRGAEEYRKMFRDSDFNAREEESLP